MSVQMDPADENDLVTILELEDTANGVGYITEDLGSGVYTIYVRDESKTDNRGRYVGNLHFSKTPDGTDPGVDQAAAKKHNVTISGAHGVQLGSHGNVQYNAF